MHPNFRDWQLRAAFAKNRTCIENVNVDGKYIYQTVYDTISIGDGKAMEEMIEYISKLEAKIVLMRKQK